MTEINPAVDRRRSIEPPGDYDGSAFGDGGAVVQPEPRLHIGRGAGRYQQRENNNEDPQGSLGVFEAE